MRTVITALVSSIGIIVGLSGVITANETQENGRVVPEIRATRVNPHPPKIDGDLSDSIWTSGKVEFARSFIQRMPEDGKPATESTLVAVAYDENALYVAFWCYDAEPTGIARQLVRRDRTASSDEVNLRLDPFHDHQSGNQFAISAAGVLRDCRFYNENGQDDSWDGVWDGAVKSQPWGWTAEMRIPYYCLRFSEKQEHTWGIDFARSVERKNEASRWSYTPVSDGRFVSNFGHLTGLTGIRPARHLELLPYTVASFESAPKEEIANPDGRDYMGNVGCDVKYALSSDLILDATINPDFGQVELDYPVLNLSAYETWFSERRPFFLEGSNLFESQYQLFYSRRIGRAPQRDVTDSQFQAYTEYPNATTILGAAKLTGKIADRTTIAILSAVTAEEEATYQTTVGARREGVVEPQASYSVARVRQDILRNSSVGVLLTLASQDTRYPATTGGLDWQLRTNNGGWQFRGQTVFSRTNNINTGYAVDAALEKTSGRYIRAAIGCEVANPHLNLNRLGYSTRGNRRHTWGWTQYRNLTPRWIFREMYHNLNAWSTWNYDGVNISLGGNYNAYCQLRNYWGLGWGVGVQGEKYSDDETRGNGLWVWKSYPTTNWWVTLDTDYRKKISFSTQPNIATDRGGTWWSENFNINVRPRSNMEFSFGVYYARYFNATMWVNNYQFSDSTGVKDSSLFADLDRDQLRFDASASLVINRNLTCQLSAQALIAGLDYRNYRFYQGGQNYGNPTDELGSYDYNWSEMNSMLLIRWEYNPGSTLYLVWTRSRPDYDPNANNLDFSRDFDRLFSRGATNVFLVKTSYWLNI
jgi:hypothetical protein